MKPAHTEKLKRQWSMLSWIRGLKTRAPGRAPRLIGPEIKLEAALAAMADAVVIADKNGTFIDFNESFAHLNRFETKSACAQALHEYWSTFEVSTLDGTVMSAAEWPLARALAGESASNVELKVTRKDINESWIGLYNFAPIRMEDGSIV